MLVWRNSQVANVDEVIVDDHAVYTLGIDHIVSAIDKDRGTTLWRTQLPSTGRNGNGLALAAGHLIVGDNGLFALDPATGRQVWTYTPSVGAWPGYSRQWTDGSTIYCGSGTGNVYAVDAASGAERWATAIVNDSETNVYSPIVSNGIVYVGYTEFSAPPHLSVRGGVAAVDAASGRLMWAQLLPHGDSTDNTGVWADPFAILVTPTTIVTQAADDKLYGLDPQSGAVVSTIAASTLAKPGFVIGSPSDLPSLALSGGLVIAASRVLTTISALSSSNLQHQWTIPFAFGSPTRIAVDATHIYSGAGAGQFAVYDMSGKLLWTINRGDLRPDGLEGFYFPPAIDSTRIYLPGSFEVYAFKKQ